MEIFSLFFGFLGCAGCARCAGCAAFAKNLKMHCIRKERAPNRPKDGLNFLGCFSNRPKDGVKFFDTFDDFMSATKRF